MKETQKESPTQTSRHTTIRQEICIFSKFLFTAISTSKDYVRKTPLNNDATPLNYNALFTDKTGNNSLNSTFVNTQEISNGTKNRTQQDIQTPSHFVNEAIVETMPATTQQSISPIHPTLTTPRNKNSAFPQTTIQSTVKPSVTPNHSQMDYQTFEPVMTTRQTNKQRTSNRNNFSDYNYNLFAKPQTTKSPYMNSQNQSRAQNYNRNVPQQAPHTVFSNDQPRATLDTFQNYPFFQQNKNMTIKHHLRNQPHYSADEEYHNQNKQRFNTNQRNNNWNNDQQDPIYQPDLLNHIHETNKHDKQDITQRQITITFSPKTL